MNSNLSSKLLFIIKLVANIRSWINGSKVVSRARSLSVQEMDMLPQMASVNNGKEVIRSQKLLVVVSKFGTQLFVR